MGRQATIRTVSSVYVPKKTPPTSAPPRGLAWKLDDIARRISSSSSSGYSILRCHSGGDQHPDFDSAVCSLTYDQIPSEILLQHIISDDGGGVLVRVRLV